MTTIPLPDLDNDTLKYRYTKGGRSIYLRPVYDIGRSINGGPFVKIGTVTRIRESDWNSSAWWEAKAIDDEHGASDYTRDGAVRSLEYRLQGPEYHERKHAEYMEQHARDQAEAEARRRNEALRARAIEIVLERNATEIEALIVELRKGRAS